MPIKLYINPLTHPLRLPRDKKGRDQKSKMVHQMRASLTCFILFLLVLATSLISVQSRNTLIPEDQAREPHKIWQRKTRMNHGSHRGPKKHLVNPTAEHPFQAREFPV
ncbi:hypothetical protein E2542_SST06372 [Spatholobus suberectus]|nr:hypothetical protein E2542_SST06372 [Spatholobus suberectus]